MKIPPFILIHDVKIKKYLGSSAYGAQYGDPYFAKMRIEPKRQRVKDPQGVEYISNAVAIADPETDIGDNYIIVYNGREYTVKDWQPMDTDVGTHHIEMVLQ